MKAYTAAGATNNMQLKEIFEILPIYHDRGFNKTLQFVVVGVGGTGGYLVRDLARLIATFNDKYSMEMSMLLIDHDEVEIKNLTRQNFVRQDIGKKKAEVLANRYAMSYGIKIDYLTEYLPASAREARKLLNAATAGHYTILIGCVDNNKTRLVMHECYLNEDSVAAYIDSGNEENAGQVVFSAKSYFLKPNLVSWEERSYPYFLPDVAERFDLSADKHPSELSCAEHALSAPQDITTNIMASSIILNYCAAIVKNASLAYLLSMYTGEDISSQRKMLLSEAKAIISPITYFDANNNSIKAEYLFDWMDSADKDQIIKRINRSSVIDRSSLPKVKKFLKDVETTRLAITKNVVLLTPQN